MNIYLHVEVAARELDSKILLGVLAASNGHEALISSKEELISGIYKEILLPGIYYTKSLTPSKTRIKRHQKIKEKGFKITSIDEEAGLSTRGYDSFAVDRFSDLSIRQSSAVFGWGPEDTNTLKKIHPNHSNKIHQTGSPRADLWKTFFVDYWNKPKGIPDKPFLLVSSNMICTKKDLFHNHIKALKNAGSFERYPALFEKRFNIFSEDYKKLYSFIDAIKYLSNHNIGYDIVLRPHPSENIEAWKIFLENIPNVHVIREDSITTWVKNSFAVMHNGCTTAIEATVSSKPVLTYIPFKMEYAHDFSNLLGIKVKNKEELLREVNQIFISLKTSTKTSSKKTENTHLLKTVSEKLYLDKNELAAEKILKLWESLNEENFSKTNNWMKFYFFVKFLNLKKKIRKILTIIYPKKFKALEKSRKFAPLDMNDISGRVSRLKNLLGIKKNLECKFFSKTSFLIKSK